MSRADGRDLVVLVPDVDIEGTVECLLKRSENMGMRPVTFSIGRHPQRDGGCRSDAVERLRAFIRDHRYAIVLFDKQGCGNPRESRELVRDDVELGLSRNGWRDCCRAIVIEPELEAWIWNGSRQVPQILGWRGDYASLREWLVGLGLWASDGLKPSDPKRALEAVLRRTRTPRSARLYRRIAETVALDRCVDPAFNEFKSTLRRWFPRPEAPDASRRTGAT